MISDESIGDEALAARAGSLPDYEALLTELRERNQYLEAELDKMADWAGFNVNLVRAMRPVVEAATAYRQMLPTTGSLANDARAKPTEMRFITTVDKYTSTEPSGG